MNRIPYRVGQGYDVHRLVEGRPLIIGGVTIESDKGLLGHSDADVLVHAVIDALFGALAMGDIGTHFPDTDPAYAGIDSMKLLREAVSLVKGQGYVLANLDATIIAQAPKMKPHISKMQANLADAFGCAPNQISVKATTEEGLGFTGRGEGISAQAVVLLAAREPMTYGGLSFV